MAGRLPAAPPVLPGLTYVRPLGTGGFADVFLFQQDMPRRPVAVKVLLEDIVDDTVLRMFNAEADVMASLSPHPSILTVYQASISSDGRPYLVMEYCPGSLTTRYRRERIPVDEVLHIGVKIASALETAHRAGLLHRDVKPSNILTTSFGMPVLSDFGIATSVRAREDDVLAMSVPWSAPEIVDEQSSGTIATEVWSLGATVYSLLAGHSPFERAGSGQNQREQLKARIRRASYTPTGRDDVPASLEQLLRSSMSRSPAGRPASAAEFAHQLQLIQHELGLGHTPIEVSTDEWASTATPVSFDDAEMRGVTRAAVAYDTRRPARSRTGGDRTPSASDTLLPGSESAPRRGSRVGLALLIVLGSLAVVAAAAAAIVIVSQGGL